MFVICHYASGYSHAAMAMPTRVLGGDPRNLPQLGKLRLEDKPEAAMKMVFSCVIAATLITPALSAEEYYVVQNVETKKCMVTNKPPENATIKLMTEEKPFPTRAAAEAAMKEIKACAT